LPPKLQPKVPAGPGTAAPLRRGKLEGASAGPARLGLAWWWRPWTLDGTQKLGACGQLQQPLAWPAILNAEFDLRVWAADLVKAGKVLHQAKDIAPAEI
jgi:hypothetical protein